MKTGDRLPNGATVIAEQAGVVLAMTPGRPMPFVTWRWDGVKPDSTCWGHYYSSIARATEDYEKRVQGEGGDARAA